MLKEIVLAMSIAIAPDMAQSVLPRSISINDLTVPPDRLPAGCTLSPSDSVHLDGNRIRGGLWAGLPIASNPWTGTDRPIVAFIRERMDGPPLEPDGCVCVEVHRHREALLPFAASAQSSR
jgi:hypothetical protein